MNTPLHIIFCGTPEFAVPSLQALIDDEACTIDLVITQPDKPAGRKQVMTSSPVKTLAEKQAIPLWQPADINTQWHARSMPHADFLVVVAYGQILSKEVLASPNIAPVNVHASLLPKYRGAAPIQHAILNGEKQSGVTIQRMVLELDAGPILAQSAITLDARETAETLHDKLKTLGADLLVRTVKQPLNPRDQDESKTTFCKKLSRKDSIADPKTMTAAEIDRRVRALVPWPGVTWNNVKLLATSLKEEKESFALPCAGNTVIYVQSVQPPGKKPMTGMEWQRGHT